MVNKPKDVMPGVKTLFGIPTCNDIDQLSVDIAFLGIPYDCGSRRWSRGGTRWAPAAIRQANSGYSYIDDDGNEAGGWFDIDTGKDRLKGVTMADCGDVNILPTDNEPNLERATRTVKKILDHNSFPLVIGGDHTITYLVVRAFEKFAPLDIVYIDAHLDFCEEDEQGTKIFNGSPFRRCSELPFVNKITQIGFRGSLPPGPKKDYEAALKHGVKVITANNFRKIGVEEVIRGIPQAKNIYISLDVDALDLSVGPGAAVPLPGGLNFREVQQLLIGIPTRGRVVGFDVACYSPAHDSSNITSRSINELILYLLGASFPSR